MAKLPTIKRITEEIFPSDVKKWLPKLLAPLNQVMEQITNALNKNLTITDNFSGSIRSVTLDGIYPLNVAYHLRLPPKIAIIGYCRETDGNHTIPTTALYLDWDMASDGSFQINEVVGLTPTSTLKYNINILILVD